MKKKKNKNSEGILATLSAVHESEDDFHPFLDTTLSCSDGRIRSSSLIWSAISPFIKRLLLLRENDDENFVLILPETPSREIRDFLKNLLNPNNESEVAKYDFFADLGVDLTLNKDYECLSQDFSGSTSTLKKLPDFTGCFGCVECSKMFRSKADLRQHSNRIHGRGLKRAFRCEKCQKGFKTKAELKVHTRVHYSAGTPPHHLCAICGDNRSFRTKRTLELHVLRKHAGLKESIPCERCGKLFKIPEDLESHVRNVHEAKLYPKHFCEICSKSFTQKETLRVHKMMHNDERPEKCLICGLKFRTATCLRKHQKTHSNVKDNICPHCPKAFSRPDHLKNHIKKIHQRQQNPFRAYYLSEVPLNNTYLVPNT